MGIYLSAHPLDEYSIILDYVCNAKLNQLEQKEELSKMEEVIIGGIVTNVRTGETKKGKIYGIVKMEDFVGNGELALFSNDWVAYRNYFVEGASLFIKLKVEPSRYQQGAFNTNVKSVDLLSEVKDKVIQKITFDVPLDKLTSIMVEDLAEIVKENPGEADLIFNIHTSDSKKILLRSRRVQVSVDKQLVQYIKEHPEIGIKVN